MVFTYLNDQQIYSLSGYIRREALIDQMLLAVIRNTGKSLVSDSDTFTVYYKAFLMGNIIELFFLQNCCQVVRIKSHMSIKTFSMK